MSKYKFPLIGVFCILILGAGFVANKWYEPHRDVQSVPVFTQLSATDFINEFLEKPEVSKKKYLAEDGDSKIVAIDGVISSIESNLNNEKVVYLHGFSTDVFIRCTFSEDQNENVESLVVGQNATIKGVVSAGAEYDEDLEMYEDAILRECYINSN